MWRLQRLAVYNKVSEQRLDENSINGEVKKVWNSRFVNKAE